MAPSRLHVGPGRVYRGGVDTGVTTADPIVYGIDWAAPGHSDYTAVRLVDGYWRASLAGNGHAWMMRYSREYRRYAWRRRLLARYRRRKARQ